ncbi:MAG: co-chaperone GroES [Myxococcota bacterium]
MKFKPLHDRILVKRVEAEERSKGGLFLPESAKEKPMQALVVAAGEGRRLADGTIRPLDVKVGDRCLFGKYSGDEIKVDGEEYLILREEDVLAVLS